MKKLIIGIALLMTATVYGFGGDGCFRDGTCPTDLKPKSVAANVTISPCRGAGQRGNLCMVKYLTGKMRELTPAQKSNNLDRRFYRGSRLRTYVPVKRVVKPLTLIDLLRAKRLKRNQK